MEKKVVFGRKRLAQVIKWFKSGIAGVKVKYKCTKKRKSD
jgi:Sec-independent protein translocase protein TatA